MAVATLNKVAPAVIPASAGVGLRAPHYRDILATRPQLNNCSEMVSSLYPREGPRVISSGARNPCFHGSKPKISPVGRNNSLYQGGHHFGTVV